MIHFDRLLLGTIQFILISLTLLEIMWIIKNKEPITIEEALVWRGNISTYQCDLIPVNYNTLTYNLYGIHLSSLFLNGFTSLISMFTSHYLLPIDSKSLAYNLDRLNPTLIFELMDFPSFHVRSTSSSPFIYTPIL